MFKSYFNIAVRKLLKNKGYTFINIFSLTIGFTCCLLISLYISNELDYDAFQKKGDRIARVIMEYKFDGGTQSFKGNFTSPRVAAVFKKDFPEVEEAVKMSKGERVVRVGENQVNEKNFMFADPGFFKVFSFPLLTGDPARVLSAPHMVVITRSTAARYFGNENPVGKYLQVGNDSVPYQITGLANDCPSNSQIKFDFLASFSSLGLGKENEETYWDANYTTYFLLRNPGARITLQARVPDFMKKEMAGQGASINFWLEPFLNIHLHSEFEGFEPNNNIVYIYILAGVALLILAIASFTFINLSTAQSLERAREVGVRKVIGAGKSQLFWQFIGESAIICSISFVFSLVLAVITLPYFNRLTARDIQPASLFTFSFLSCSLIISALVSLLAGSYPAFVLTRFQPVKVLKGIFKNMGSGKKIRQSLIIFQFAISVFMIVSAFIIQKQLNYIQNKKLGYDRTHVLVIPVDPKILPRLPLVKLEFKTDPEIISVSACVRTPVEGGGGYTMRSSLMPQNEQIAVTANPVDQDFIKTTGISIVAGEDLSEQDIKDVSGEDQKQRTYKFILNESATRELGWTAAGAVGKKMFLGDYRVGYVKGVVKDFNFESLHNPVKPIVLFPELRANKLLVKLNGRNLARSISLLALKWKKLITDRPFEYRFLDDDFTELYISELRLGRVMNLFSILAILLACLGLFGLSSYAIHQRIKEIGVRKVLGASVKNIVVLLSKDLMKLTGISLLVAFPVAWWGMTRWLQNFAYRTEAGPGIYLVAGAIVLSLALLTVAFQAVKAAIANPVTSLRSE